jgi:hypothetical protein
MDSSEPGHVEVKDSSEHCNEISGAMRVRNISFFLETISVSERAVHYGVSKFTSDA